MKGDFTKSTFQPEKHYTSVRMQQGRLQLDADWNEQVDILAYLNQTQVKDIIGISGVPETNGGFAISTTADGKDLTISAGHIYVNGILCELEKPITYKNQPDYPNVPATDNNTYVVYLDVWQRHITAIEDPDIREIALTHVPDTATRTKIVCQVKLILQSEWENFLQKRENRQVKITAHVKPYSGLGSAIAGDQGLENQLYRVEIHKVDNKGTQFKWSRDNGSTVSAITDIKDNTILIKNFGREDLQFFTAGQWIEVTDEMRELQNQPGTLVRLTSVTSDGKLNFDPDTEDGDRITLENFPLKDNRPKVRRWDNNSKGDTAAIAIDTAEWIPLEAGIEVQFNRNDFYQPGDYWQFPVRAEQKINEIPWSDKLQPAKGIQHHYCALAKVTFDGTAFQNVQEQRIKFDTLSQKSTVLENKLDTTGGVLTGSLGVGVKEQQEIRARLYIQGEASKTGTGTISSPQNGTEVIGSGTFFQKELHAGDIITADSQTRAIAVSDNPPGTFTVNLPWTTEISQGTHFNYQPPIAHFVSSTGATQLIINALGNLGIGTLTPTEKLEVVGKVKTTNLEVTSAFTADTFIGNHLQISGDSNIAGVLSVGNNLNVTGRTTTANLNVTETSQSDTFTGNHLQISGDSNIAGVLSVGNNLNVTGITTTANLNVTETSQSDTFIGNHLQISGDSNIAGVLSVGNNLNVTGITTTANLNVMETSQSDTFIGNHLQISGDSNIAGVLSVGNNLNVTGITTTANLNVTETSQSDTFIGNHLQISGDSNIAGVLFVGNNLNVTGRTTSANLNVTETSQSDKFIGNNLQINGNASLGIGEQPARLYVQGSPAINTPGSNVTSLNSRKIQVQSNGALELHPGDLITAAGETRLITQTNPLTINNAFSNELNQAAFTYQQPNIRIAASDGETQLVITAQNNPDSQHPSKVAVGIIGSDTKLEIESSVDITGNLTALNLANSSSRTLKENIVDLSSQEVVELLNLLNPMKFNYKNDESQKQHAGFIAEDIPDLFTSADKTAINLLDIIAVLTKVVKDQQKTIAIISQFVKAHQTTIQTLSEKVKKLEGS